MEDVGDYPAATMPRVQEVPPSTYPVQNRTDDTLQPGDAIEIFVEEDDSIDGKYEIRERGDIIIPNVGRIILRGMSVIDASSRIRSELESSQLKKATVIVDRIHKAPRKNNSQAKPVSTAKPKKARLTIYMSGSVRKPGQHLIPVPETGRVGVYEAILISGGLNQFGDPSRIHILRNDADGKKRKIPVNIKEIEKGLTEDPMIGEGDIVLVPEKVFGF